MLEVSAKLKVENRELVLTIEESQILKLLFFYPYEIKNGNSVSLCYDEQNDGIFEDCEFRIVLHKELDFFGFTTAPEDDTKFVSESLQFGQAYYLRRVSEDTNKGWRRLPTLHLSVLNMLRDDIYRYMPTFPRYASIMDNSIWNYYYSLQTARYDSNHQKLKEILCEIAVNSFNKLYGLSNSLEYANHNARLIRESYISNSKGHGHNVSPFLFHSESEHKESAEKEYKKNNENNLIYRDGSFTHKWRILLLDDHALCPMSRIGNEETTAKEKTSRIEYIDKTPDKLRIISHDLRLLYPKIKIGYVKSDDGDKPIYDELTNESVDKDESYDIVFYCLSSVCKAISALESHRFEIVLLDYLLGEKDDGTREYSYELLKKLEKRYNENEKENEADLIFGPHRRLYFSFISAFTTAVNERLLAEGLHKSEKFWHIADGACPTNTPYLFLYNLLHLMNKRVEDMGLHKLSDISKDRFANSWIKEKIINEIYGKEEDEGKKVKVRQNANETFDEVLSLLYHYKKLLDDVHSTDNVFNSTRSVLATDFVKKNPNLGGFLEHLTQLVYLTAFGTVRQWPEMWEEYLFISSIVGPQQKIEEYIMKLKSNNI